jgi:hypothetical protein
MTPGFLAPQGPKFFFAKLLPPFFLAHSGIVYHGAPLVGVARKILAAGTKFSDTLMAGPLGGAAGRSGSGHHRSWRHGWRAPGGAAGGFGSSHHPSWRRRWRAPWGCCWQVQQRTPSELATPMVGPLGGAAGRSGSGHHRSWRRQWRAPWGVLLAGPAAATIGVGDVDGGPPGGAADRSSSGHHQSWRCRWRGPLHPWQYEVSSIKKRCW